MGDYHGSKEFICGATGLVGLVGHHRIDRLRDSVHIFSAAHRYSASGGLSFLAGDGVEKVFLVTSITLALGSFYSGVRYHKHLYIFLFLVSGMALIVTGRVWVDASFEIPFVVSGTSVLAAGHLLNRRLCRLCATCAEHQGRKFEASCTPAGRHRRFWSSHRRAGTERGDRS
jgi:hypothetical protein